MSDVTDSNAEPRDLAGEYVLGILDEQQRKDFEQHLAEDIYLQHAVVQWEQRLDKFNHSLAPLKPPGYIWRLLKKRIKDKPHYQRSWLEQLWQSLGIWHVVSGTASMAALILAMLIWWPQLLTEEPMTADKYIAVVSDKAQKPLWLIQFQAEDSDVKVTLLNPRPIPPDKDYELWMLPEDGSAPLSMGLLASNRSQHLSLKQGIEPGLAKALAVSLEPKGGSPSGTPTGPVLFVADLSKAY